MNPIPATLQNESVPRVKIFDTIVGPLSNKAALTAEQRHAIVMQFSRTLMQHDARMRSTTLLFM